MENNNAFELDGFTAVFNSISKGEDDKTSGNDMPIIDPEEIKRVANQVSEEEEEEFEEEREQEELEEEFEEEEEVHVKPTTSQTKNTSKKKEVEEEVEGFGDAEPEMAEYIQDKLFEQFGWEKGDSKFESLEDVVNFVKEVIEENSLPEFADEEVQRIDDYVRNGGDLKHYMDNVYGGVNASDVDINNTADQKILVRENLKLKGYSEARIKKAIERYEDAGTLREEAEDAKEMLEDYQSKISEKLLEEQKSIQSDIKERQLKYFQSVEQEVKGLSDIRGIDISPAEKKELLEYIFKPTSNGRTQYQNDYAKSHKNLIESAYFTMKGDKLIQKVKSKANSEAALKLRKKLASKGNRGKDQGTQGTSYESFLTSAFGQLRKPF